MVKITIESASSGTREFPHVDIAKQWVDWSWLLFALPIIEAPGFEHLEYKVDDLKVRVEREP